MNNHGVDDVRIREGEAWEVIACQGDCGFSLEGIDFDKAIQMLQELKVQAMVKNKNFTRFVFDGQHSRWYDQYVVVLYGIRPMTSEEQKEHKAKQKKEEEQQAAYEREELKRLQEKYKDT